MLVQAPADQARNLGRLEGSAVGIFAGTLRHSGEIQATTATLEGGVVQLLRRRDEQVPAGHRDVADHLDRHLPQPGGRPQLHHQLQRLLR